MNQLPNEVTQELNSLLKEMLQDIPTPIDPLTEVCVPMLIEKGLNENMASRMVKEKEKKGELVSRPAMYRGQRVKAYRRA